MNIKRIGTKAVKIGNVTIGSGYPIAIQSMTKTDTVDVAKTVAQIRLVQKQGCQIIRVAIKEERAAQAIKRIKQAVDIPIVADIHFDYRLALAAMNHGADKIRLNPGNIYKEKEIAQVVSLAKERNIPIRVGINSGSIRAKSKDNADNLVKSALDYIKLLERRRFRNIVISLKSSSVTETVQANRKISNLVDYPLHLGVTATGLSDIGFVKSAICLGLLLSEGIGDTIRVSLTAHPCQEVIAAKKILAALDIGNPIDVIACPTCGRCEVDLVGIVQQIEGELKLLNLKPSLGAQPLKVAVMGCVVNGPGEARCADLGIAFGKGFGLFFKNGKPVRKINQKQAANFLVGQIKKVFINRKAS